MDVTATVERSHPDGCRCTYCLGFRPGNLLAMRHGAVCERRIRPLSRNHRRRLLRQFGLRASEIDAAGKAYLELLSRTTAKIALIDEWLDAHGLVRDDGSLQPCMTTYVSLVNSSTRTLTKLVEHLRVEERDPAAVLAALRSGL